MPGFNVSQWTALWAPKGTPKDIIAKLNGAVVEALADSNVLARLADLDRSYLAAAAPANAPHVLSAFPLLKIEDYRY